jgi:hypothetical protein
VLPLEKLALPTVDAVMVHVPADIALMELPDIEHEPFGLLDT